MYAEINCLNPHDIQSNTLWEDTQALIQRKAQHLRKMSPSLDKSEIHLKARHNMTSVRLIFHDKHHQTMETHVKSRNLNQAISACFAKAERVLMKAKR